LLTVDAAAAPVARSLLFAEESFEAGGKACDEASYTVAEHQLHRPGRLEVGDQGRKLSNNFCRQCSPEKNKNTY
jgi:hypothetical protein